MQREKSSAHATLVKSLQQNDERWFFDYMRMSLQKFQELLSIVESLISKQDTNWRRCISASERLSLTLRHLATGESRRSLPFAYFIGRSTVTQIIEETIAAISEILQPRVLQSPTKKSFTEIAKEFEARWNFPNCVGSIDGKHIQIKCPEASGSYYFNYKGFFSIVFHAVADAHYRFTLVDIGAEGSSSDAGVFSRSEFGKAILSGTLELPPSKPMPDDNMLPSVFVADEAFPLHINIMRPFPGGKTELDREKRAFNYRLSRARMCVENAFGILAARWRVFHSPIFAKLSTIRNTVKTCVCLHNFLMAEKTSSYCPRNYGDRIGGQGEMLPGQWRSEAQDVWKERISRQSANNYTELAAEVRSSFAKYFS
jgi:hypothetical protein